MIFVFPIDFDANSKNINAKLEKSFKINLHKKRKIVKSIFSYHYEIKIQTTNMRSKNDATVKQKKNVAR